LPNGLRSAVMADLPPVALEPGRRLVVGAGGERSNPSAEPALSAGSLCPERINARARSRCSRVLRPGAELAIRRRPVERVRNCWSTCPRN
jgi:hypothetical protein